MKAFSYLILAGTLCWSAMSSALEMSIIPAQPRVYPAATVYFVITSAEGSRKRVHVGFGHGLEIQPGDVAERMIYIEKLPASASHTYNVQVYVTGWRGPRNDPNDELNISGSFQAQ